MTFEQAWSYAKLSAKRALELSMSMTQKPGIEVKYTNHVYSRGSFYFEGLMYHTDDGSLVNPVGDVDIEMMRIRDMINDLH